MYEESKGGIRVLIGSEIEFKFLKLCFYKPELWAIGYVPIDPLANWCYEAVKKYSAKYRKYPNFDTFMAYSKSLCESQQYDTIKENFEVKIDTEYTLENIQCLFLLQSFLLLYHTAVIRIMTWNRP